MKVLKISVLVMLNLKIRCWSIRLGNIWGYLHWGCSVSGLVCMLSWMYVRFHECTYGFNVNVNVYVSRQLRPEGCVLTGVWATHTETLYNWLFFLYIGYPMNLILMAEWWYFMWSYNLVNFLWNVTPPIIIFKDWNFAQTFVYPCQWYAICHILYSTIFLFHSGACTYAFMSITYAFIFNVVCLSLHLRRESCVKTSVWATHTTT